MTDIYAKLGVDAGKKSVREIWKKVVDNDFPDAFVVITRDRKSPGKVFTHHLDGGGSKLVQRALVFAETGDISVFRGDVDDAFQMNLGDISASGFVFGKTVFGDVVNIREYENVLPKDAILIQMAERYFELKNLYRHHGFVLYFCGGETADLPDNLLNMTTDVAVYAEAKESDIIKGNVQNEDAIYGFRNGGMASWETASSSDLMANGFTLCRTRLMSADYNEKYPHLRGKNPYKGRFKVGEVSELMPEMSVSDALILPTRQWSILVRILIEKLKEAGIFHKLHAISLNTGGGATKIGHVGHNILYRKCLPSPPAIFQLIQQEGNVSWEEMFKVFNCGWGIDVVGENDNDFYSVLEHVSIETNVAFDLIGHCYNHSKGNQVTIQTPYGFFDKY